MKTVLSILCLFVGLSTAVGAAEGTVDIKKNGSKFSVTIDGKPFATYNTSADLPKPFFSPVRAADGTVITRSLVDPEDHPHHKGIWVAVDEVNTVDFWAEKGKIKNTGVKIVKASGNPAVMKVTNEWLGEDNKPIITENTLISIYANRLMTYNITFTAGAKPVVFEDTKEGLFGIRLPNGMREKEDGSVVNSKGVKGTKDTWGKPTEWIDYYGPLNGKVYGVTLMDSPQNYKQSRYHVRNYGLFTISPFGDHAYTNKKQPADHKHLKAGEKMNLKYGLYIHSGDTKQGHVADAYQQFVDVTKKKATKKKVTQQKPAAKPAKKVAAAPQKPAAPAKTAEPQMKPVPETEAVPANNCECQPAQQPQPRRGLFGRLRFRR
ncbi:hypothetical protein FYZ48_20060 [Gimesia chilikensis]|uniref:DUF6807 domain-containing protein n=1 Tax=Gimesia chilikensis TaxID=2605989 RepID=UPI0011ECE6EF|nr:PmoA family protein [Gimesia chilikensis]KAA0134801.1 hypothetical protein FYZ48_20060 [Gimesia chilikensis]